MHARFGGNIFSKVLIKQNNLENVNEITDLKSFPVFENVTFFKESNVINVENPSFSIVGLCMVNDHTYLLNNKLCFTLMRIGNLGPRLAVLNAFPTL